MSNTSDMQAFKVNGQVIVTELSHAEIVKNVARASALIKTMCGIGNNAAWACCLEAMDYIRQHPNYRHKVKKTFNDVMEAFKAYERKLIYTAKNRLFHLDDLTPEYRKRYAAITDREYYDYWASTGATAYTRKRQWVTNLWNKYRVSLLSHDVKDAEHVAWVMTTQAALDLAVVLYKKSIEECRNSYGLNESLLTSIFGQFNLQTISDDWRRAMLLLEPQIESIKLDDTEDKNIQHGLRQLLEAWTDPELLYSSTSAAVEDYEEIFSTQGFKKKVLREISEVKAETLAELEKE